MIAAAEQAVAATPDILRAVRAVRAFLGRTVDHLAARAGIRQFLDIGTGLPTADNTHEADLRDVDTILAAAAVTLDLDRPVGLILAAVLQYIPDADDPYAIVARILGRLAPGSHLVVSHPAGDIQTGEVAESMRRYNERAAEQATPRTREEVSRFFAGLRLLDPGIVQIPYWRPEPGVEPDASIFMWGGVGATT